MIDIPFHRILLAGAALFCAHPSTAREVFINNSSRTIILKVSALDMSKARFILQVHKTGRTPKTDSTAVMVDSPGGGRETKLPYHAMMHNISKEIHLVKGLTPEEVRDIPEIVLRPSESLHFHTTGMDKGMLDEKNQVTFAIGALFLDKEMKEARRSVDLQVVYSYFSDRWGWGSEALAGTRAAPGSGTWPAAKWKFSFAPKGLDDTVLSLRDHAGEGCACAIL